METIKMKNKPVPTLIKYVPHGLNEKMFRPITSSDPEYNDFTTFKKQLFKNKEYDFVLFFNSRNIRRKQIPDSLLAYKLFIDSLPEDKAKKCAFVLHTDLVSEHGTDLPAVAEYLFGAEEKYNIIWSSTPLAPNQMNWLYNCTDTQILITDNEGWGLSLTEAILVGNPIIANVQGGMQDQMRFEDYKGKWIDFNLNFPSNHRGTYTEHGEWAFPVYPSSISIQGSPLTPYISGDRVSIEDAAHQIENAYVLDRTELKRRGLLGREWALSDEAGFTSSKMGNRIIESLDKLFDTWKPREDYELINVNKVGPKTIKHDFLY